MRLTGRSARRLAIPLALAAVVAAGAWTGSQRQPMPPAFHQAAASSLPESGAGRPIAFGQFNIHRGRAADGDIDLERTAECLRGLDIVSLNEVAGGGLLGGADQASALAERLDLRPVFAPTERRYWHPHFGNALLAAGEPASWLRLPLPRAESDGYRNMLLATLRVDSIEIALLVTHVDSGPDRDAQLAAVLALFHRLAPPALLMGDLNATISHPLIAALLDTPGVVATNGSLHPTDNPRTVDWLIGHGFEPLEASQCDNGASDHPSVSLVARPLP